MSGEVAGEGPWCPQLSADDQGCFRKLYTVADTDEINDKKKTSDKIPAITFGNATQTTSNSSDFIYLWDKIKILEQLRNKAPLFC